jgi:hypothetical protein
MARAQALSGIDPVSPHQIDGDEPGPANTEEETNDEPAQGESGQDAV